MRLTVHMLTGKTLIIEADPNTEVKQLKANLYKHTGMNNEIRLMFGSTELLDAYTLSFYEIESDSDLQMIFQPDVFINVTVQLLRKQTVSMRTKNSTSIAAFKANLWNFHNIKGAMHKHRLFYGDTELDDDLLPLHYYGINNGSILQLVGESVIKVTVINSRNQYGFVKMRLSETILDLKQKLSHSMKNIHVDMMLLFLKVDEDEFEELQDDATIEDYRIRTTDILHIITYKQWVTPIKIKVPGTDLSWIIRGIEHTKNSQDTILSLKLLIQDQLDLPVNSQRLFASTALCVECVETENTKRLGSYCKDSFRFYLKDDTG